MGLFDKLREPVVLKEDSSAKKQLEQLSGTGYIRRAFNPRSSM